MDEILNEIDQTIENNEYYLDNFDFMTQKLKNIVDALDCFCKNRGDLAIQKLYNVTRDDLIKLFVLCARFYDSKEEHEEVTEVVSFLMHDGKNLKAKATKFELLIALSLLIQGDKKNITNRAEKKQLRELEKTFEYIYDEEYLKLLKKVAEIPDFVLLFYTAYNYFDVLKFDYSDYDIPDEVESLRNEKAADLIQEFIEDEKTRVFFTLVNFDALYTFLFDATEKYRKELRSVRKENNKLIAKAQKLRELYNKKDKEVISSKDLKNILDDSEESFKILSSLAISNSKLVSKLEDSFGKKEQIIYILYNYHYNFDEIAPDLEDDIDNIDTNILRENLDKLSKLSITISNQNLLYIIKNNVLINVERIKPFISKNYINVNIINKNIRILIEDEEFLNYSNNIKLLERFNINIVDLVGSYYELLLINNNFLKEIFNLAKIYNLKLDSNNILLLVDSLNFDNVDLFIEEGYSEYIVNNLNLLSRGDIIPKRLHINNLVNSDLVESSSIDEDILNEGTFFVSDRQLDDACSSKTYLFQNEEIKNYLDNSLRITISEKTLNSDIVLKLDSKYRTDNVYDFDGVIISRNKVLRNLDALSNTKYSIYDKVLNSVIYNSLLGIDDVKNISNEIKSTFGNFKSLK